MRKRIYYEVTEEDRERVAQLVDRFNELVGRLQDDKEKLILSAYDSDFTVTSIYDYDKAWNVMQDMINKTHLKQTTSKLDKYSALSNLCRDIKVEQTYLSGIFSEFEQIGIYVE